MLVGLLVLCGVIASAQSATVRTDQKTEPAKKALDVEAAVKDFLANGEVFQSLKSPASSMFAKIKASNRQSKTQLEQPKVVPEKKKSGAAAKVRKAHIDRRPDLLRTARAEGQRMHKIVIGCKPKNIKELEEKLLDVSYPSR